MTLARRLCARARSVCERLRCVEKRFASAHGLGEAAQTSRSDAKRPSAPLPADAALAGAPSVLFDAVVLAPSAEGAAVLARQAAAIDFVRDAFGHLKVIGFTETAAPLLAAAGIAPSARDEGVVALGSGSVKAFIGAAGKHRIWKREPTLRDVHAKR